MRKAFGVAAILALAGGAALALPTTSSEIAADYAAKRAHGLACGWLTPAESEALRLASGDSLTSIEVKDGATALAAARAEVAKAETAGAARPCAEPEKTALKIAAGIVLNDWVVRSVALLDAEGRQPYGANLSTAGARAPALRAGFAALQQKKDSAVGYKAIRDVFADRAVARVCAERKTVRWPSGARPCPTLSADDLKVLPSSRFLVAGVESFAPLYAAPLPAAPVANAVFKAEPKHPLASQNGQPLWQVYNDCSWAYYKASDALMQADKETQAKEAAEAARRKTAKAASPDDDFALDQWDELMAAQTANMEGLARLGQAEDLADQGGTFTERAIDAYAAQTGKPRPEAKAFVNAKDPVARLTTTQCGALRPTR